MEWRIIFASLCLIGILPVPGNAANETGSANSTAINIIFSINDTFQDAYKNMSAPDTISLSTNITTQLDPVFKKLSGYLSMSIVQFSNGSIVTDGKLQFNASVNSPNETDVKKVITDAIASGNVTIKIINGSINVKPPLTPVMPDTNATSTTNNTITTFNLTFSILDTFNDSLSNMSSPDSINLIARIQAGCYTLLKKKFSNIVKFLVWRFRKGSIVADSSVQFDGSAALPTGKSVATAMAEGVEAATGLKINTTSISVTDNNGTTVFSSSPVLSCMLTALWMTLASLLLTGVMQF